MIKTRCTNCGTIYDVEDAWFGQTVTCQKCNKDFIIDRADTSTISNQTKTTYKPEPIIYVITAIILGQIGTHNFYARQNLTGLIKIILFILGGLCMIASIMLSFTYESIGMLFSYVMLFLAISLWLINFIICVIEIINCHKNCQG